MCGRCLDGYSESLLSPECKPNEECSINSWFWSIVAGYGLFYVIFFLFDKEWSIATRKFGRWLWKYCRPKEAKEDQVDVLDEYNPPERRPGAYLTIFMYYVQVPSLLVVSLYYTEERDERYKELTDNAAKVFQFDTLGLTYSSCLFENVTPAQKVFVKTAFVGYLFAVLVIMLLFSLLVQALCACAKKRERNKGFGITRLPLDARFILGFTILVLYTYEFISENFFTVLKCEEIFSLGKSVLYIDGTIQCYQIWQYVVIAFVCLYIVPMFAVVGMAPILLKEGKIRLRTFILSLIFPLIALPHTFYLYVKYRRQQKQLAEPTEPIHERFGSLNSVLYLVVEPYDMDRTGGLCWEGAIILRRLILIAIATLVRPVITRHMLLVIVCMIILVVHVRIQPFKRKSSNIVEGVSLFILLGIAIMNLVKAVYWDSAVIPKGPADTIFRVYDIIEKVLISLVPLTIAAFVLLCIILRLMLLPCEMCCKKKENPSNAEPNSSSPVNDVSKRSKAGYGTAEMKSEVENDAIMSFSSRGSYPRGSLPRPQAEHIQGQLPSLNPPAPLVQHMPSTGVSSVWVSQ